MYVTSSGFPLRCTRQANSRGPEPGLSFPSFPPWLAADAWLTVMGFFTPCTCCSAAQTLLHHLSSQHGVSLASAAAAGLFSSNVCLSIPNLTWTGWKHLSTHVLYTLFSLSRCSSPFPPMLVQICICPGICKKNTRRFYEHDCEGIRMCRWATWLACKTFMKSGPVTRILISGDQKLWEGGHGGLPDSCVFDLVKADCSVRK